MDITFEDVAHVIQDARFQQAIGKDPEPEKRIKLPNNFDVDEFMKSPNNSLKALLSEPLGRFFLAKLADVTQVLEGAETTAIPRPEIYQRDNNGFDHQVLKFAEEWFELRKRDTKGVTPLVDLIVLIDKHGLIEFFDDAMRKFKSQKSMEFLTTETTNPESQVHDVEPIDIISKQDTVKEVSQYDNEADYDFNELKEKELKKTDLILEKDHSVQPQVVQTIEKSPDRKFPPSRSKTLDSTSISRMDTYKETEVHTVREKIRHSNSKLAQSHSTLKHSESDYGSSSQRLVNHGQHGVNGSDSLDVHSMRTKDVNQRLEAKLLEYFKPRYVDLTTNPDLLREYVKFKYYSMKTIEERDVNYHRLLGQGAFGSVYGCIIAEIGVVMAMKIMMKKKVKLKKAKNQVEAEKDTLMALAEHPSPYCMKLRYAFQTKENYHLILPLAVGGDLKFHLTHSKALEPARYRLYAAEIAYGMGHLHTLGYIMRDLKPRNVLLDSDGHCKISDFGLAIHLSNGVYKGRAGTEGYWSPEVLEGQEYGYDCDWWSYGCCLYELVTGRNPFSTKVTGLETRNQGTLSGKVVFPDDIDLDAKDLIDKLLKKDKSERMCTTRTGVDDLMKQTHPFWAPLDLLAIRQGTQQAPWKPEKGKIYAARQQDIADNDAYNELRASHRKLKLGKDDDIPFEYFIDSDMHQKDIVQIIPLNTKLPMLLKDRWDVNERIEVTNDSCTCVETCVIS